MMLEDYQVKRKSDGEWIPVKSTPNGLVINVGDTVQDPTILPASPEPDDEEIRTYTNKWPKYPFEFREACEEFAEELEKLSYKLMELIALSLGLPEDRFHTFGVGRHKDAGALTVLAQDDVGGLEVKRKSDGEWILVKPTPDAFIINVGDIIQVWSNETFESEEHRVMVNSERERFSIPFFFNPAHYTIVKPLEEVTIEPNPPRYKPYNWGKFFFTKKGSIFKKLNVENIQIYHFRISELADRLQGALAIDSM
ncbi:hypothetical protein REPUB_Repub04eG0067100 [Reevesia pubescens]